MSEEQKRLLYDVEAERERVEEYLKYLQNFGVEDAIDYFKEKKNHNSEEIDENARWLYGDELERFIERAQEENIDLSQIRIAKMVRKRSDWAKCHCFELVAYELCYKKIWEKYINEFLPCNKVEGWRYVKEEVL